MITHPQFFKDCLERKTKLLYCISGEEPFQSNELILALKQAYKSESDFNIEVFDGEGLSGDTLLSSLNMLSSLFSEGKGRLVICHRFDKILSAEMESLEKYFQDPNPDTCFLITVTKIDKRKAWAKAILEKGSVLEVSDPYPRDFIKWKPYFEKKNAKTFEPAAWERLLDVSQYKLSLLSGEIEKIAVYLPSEKKITEKNVETILSGTGSSDVFKLVELISLKKQFESFMEYDRCLKSGESDIKILGLLIRQFRMVEHCLVLLQRGISDSKALAPQIGSHPFFVTKVIEQAKGHTRDTLKRALVLLGEADFKMKTGVGNLFDQFLVPYFTK